MKTNMNDIDELIKKTLSEEEAKFYDDLEEQSLLGMLGGLFKGKLTWLVILMNIVNLIGFVLFIYCVVQFINTENTNELIKWLAAAAVCWSFMAMIKIFVWMQMNKNAMLRELKRLELQVAILQSNSKSDL